MLALINQYFDSCILEIEITYITDWLFKIWMEINFLYKLLIIEQQICLETVNINIVNI